MPFEAPALQEVLNFTERRNRMGRNTKLLQEIVSVIQGEAELNRLEAHFHRRLLVDAGSTEMVASLANGLWLSITPEECANVLDHLAEHAVVSLTIDQVEAAVYDLFGNRFVEPP